MCRAHENGEWFDPDQDAVGNPLPVEGEEIGKIKIALVDPGRQGVGRCGRQVEPDLDVGMLVFKLAQRRADMAHDERMDCDCHVASDARPAAANVPHQVLEVGEYRDDASMCAFALRRERRSAPGVPGEQRRPEAAFQFAHMLTDRHLGYADALGAAPEAAVLDHLRKDLELAEGDA